MNLSGKRVNILGAGRSGRAAAELALREGAQVHVFDAKDPVGFPESVSVHGGVNPGAAEPCDVLVVSPGIDTYGPLVAAFSEKAGEVIGEIELACRYYSGRIIAITGTNGKTTTTELVERLLKGAGYSAVACGNYGVPVCEVVMLDPQPDVLALEASSFQLETIVDFRPDVAVWLNFAPDHMDRYPDVESYRRAKWRIFENLTADQYIVSRHGENLPASPAATIQFSTECEDADWWSEGEHLFLDGEEVFNLRSGSHLRGLHNAENAMAALAACEALSIPREKLLPAFDGYAPPRHRCELVRTLDGVEWLNDSKATNLHALESALRSQTRPIVLMAGGKEKGLDYSPVLGLLQKHAVAAVTFGQIGPALGALFRQVVPSEICDTLSEAILTAQRMATHGQIVLLSPGTSSFDQFSGYEERGDVFCKLVNDLR
ncbi:UDP-N-acetylmuramoylalanine--D-glutamate ligase [Haloferula luteola]|uniref:UDP-N-acetylmuramoylalanine--D-glutamate ligase n=1 Tax=Haloferula luteola TaxID=595692 RepID=A0A840VDJ3_9BACT|nr:UDP-N-acetylmuramoyl-L-alanine--D-glutamate ligase [Haloferula luteola]MBB5351950.1 UDP-N-acetylmuramoylalanine--D-glutamate ligase [Haloferula luteola]